MSQLSAMCPECGRNVREGLPGGERLTFFVPDETSINKLMRDAKIKLGLYTVTLLAISGGLVASLDGLAAGAGFATVLGLFNLVNLTRMIRNMRRSYAGRVLVMGPHELLSRLPGSRDVRLRRAEATGVAEREQAGLTIYGRKPLHRIQIDSTMPGYKSARAELFTWAPMCNHHSDWQELALWVVRFGMGMLGTFMVVGGSRWLAGVGMVIHVAAVISVIRAIRQSPTMDRRKAWLLCAVMLGGMLLISFIGLKRLLD